MAGINDIAKGAAVSSNAVEKVFDQVLTFVKSGQSVRIQGFGTFERKTRAARKGRNPQTGEEIAIPEKQVLDFKAAKGVEVAEPKKSSSRGRR